MNNDQIEFITSAFVAVAVRIAKAMEDSNRIANKALAVNRELLEIMKKAQEGKL